MKTKPAVAVVLAGMVSAGPVWGHSADALAKQLITPATQRSFHADIHPDFGTWKEGYATFHESGAAVRVNVGYSCHPGEPLPAPLKGFSREAIPGADDPLGCNVRLVRPYEGGRTLGGHVWPLPVHGKNEITYSMAAPLPGTTVKLLPGTDYIIIVELFGKRDRGAGAQPRYTRMVTHLEHHHYRTPSAPEPPAPPPEPDPPDPPLAECDDHIAIVPAMPGALSGGEDAADHTITITNPGAAGITFTVTGRDESGTKGGTYRRELPASQSVKVTMRAIEAAFDVTDPEGWWTLTVIGTGPLYASATMKQGEARRPVPVERPATCGTGPVTRTGG